MPENTNTSPPIDAEPRLTLSALCCECGNLRAIHSARLGQAEWDRGRRGGEPGIPGEERCTLDRRCPACRKITIHAYLRADGDPYRDWFEPIAQRFGGDVALYNLDA